MKKLNVKFENCYGIKQLEYEFDFSTKNTYQIYASNGIMKTSFTKVFSIIKEGGVPCDEIYTQLITLCEIKLENRKKISPETIFVIDPYNNLDYTGDVAPLLANKKLQLEYDQLHKIVISIKEDLLFELKTLIKVNTTEKVEEVLNNTFNELEDYPGVSEILISLKSKIENSNLDTSEIDYACLFNKKVMDFLKEPNIVIKIKDYIDKYTELLESPIRYLKPEFDPYNIQEVKKSLTQNNFFKVNNSINLYNGKGKTEIKNANELDAILKKDLDDVLNNKDLQEKWNEIYTKINKNVDLRNFGKYICNHKFILLELDDIDNFHKKTIIAYLKQKEEKYQLFIKEYKNSEKRINEIVVLAKKEQKRWTTVISDFNKRFFVPFTLKIENQSDIILKKEVPKLKFVFQNQNSKIKEEELTIEELRSKNTLSSGETRVLYLLNILFDIANIENKETLFIIDDIADSFDYRNKYAIIQYLLDLSNNSKFKLIILTHNFDFFRTLCDRVVPYKHCLIANKLKSGEIVLDPAEGIKNIFKDDYLVNLERPNKSDPKKFIATIPFARNIIEYTKNTTDEDYKTLTNVLHIKPNSKNVTIAEIKKILDKTFNINIILTDKFKGEWKIIDDLIYKLANTYETNYTPTGFGIEEKLILSIAIRLKSEEYMINKIADPNITDNIPTKQTNTLFKEYNRKFPQSKNLNCLESVILMTNENIHLNSFMYEPIIDMSIDHLLKLYSKVKNLT